MENLKSKFDYEVPKSDFEVNPFAASLPKDDFGTIVGSSTRDFDVDSDLDDDDDDKEDGMARRCMATANGESGRDDIMISSGHRKEVAFESLLPPKSVTRSPLETTHVVSLDQHVVVQTPNSLHAIVIRLYEFFVPPSLPRDVQIFHITNLAIPVSYLMVGIQQGLSGPLLNVLPLDLGATEAQQITLFSVRTIPASFKIFFGFYSDGHKLFGYRRKSYMMIGWIISGLAMVVLGLVTEKGTWGKFDDSTRVDDKYHVPHSPSIKFLSTMVLIYATGYWYADVMADSVVAEKAKLEPEKSRGQLQSTCYACTFLGKMLAAPLSTYMYETYGPRSIMMLCGFLPLITMVPLISFFVEEFNPSVPTPAEQCREIWRTVCSRAVWQPMGFVYIFNILQIGNAAWKEFLRSVLGFTSVQLNALLVLAYVLLYFGIIAYKYYFITWSWRTIYIFTTLLNGIFSLGQVLLIKGKTFGLSNFWFAIGDDVFADFISGIQFLPTTIMMVNLCPIGSEGASYAMFTTISNSAASLASAISTNILRFFDVSKETMISGDLSGLTKLAILTTILQTSGILFVWLLPHRREDLLKLNYSDSSKICGGLFLAVTALSLTYSVVVCTLNVTAPGWAGES